MTEERNKNAGTKICIIFYNCPDESFTLKKMLDRSGLPEGTVKSRIHRLYRDKIIKRYKTIRGTAFEYKILDMKKAKEYIEGRIGTKVKKKSSIKQRATPTPPIIDVLDRDLNGVPHHKIQQVKLTDDEWSRTEHLYTKPKSEKDRGQQHTLERKGFKLVISPNTLNGALYILEDNWKGDLQEIYPELAEQIQLKEELAHYGISFDGEVWQNFKMQSEDMKLVFATSHFWRELDVEGREIAVNSFMKKIMMDSFDKTTYDAINGKLIESMLIKQEGFDERMFQQIKILQSIDEKLEKMDLHNEKVVEILDKLTTKIIGVGGEPKPEDEKKEQEIKPLNPEDQVMFG